MEGSKFPMAHMYLVCCPSSIDGLGVRKSCSLNHCEEQNTLWAHIIGVNGVLQTLTLKIPQYEPVEECMEPVQLLFVFHQVCSGWWWAGLFLM